tara:strand:- start:108 stop:566 length:459 start_codon:yes stop_codon:yes gene_type:complete
MSWLLKYDTIIKKSRKNVYICLKEPLEEFIETGMNLQNKLKVDKDFIIIKDKELLEKELYNLVNIIEVLCKEKYNYEFNDLYKKCRDIFEKKNSDYGDSFVDYGLIGILVRLGDKFNRINSLINKKTVNYESIDDTILDSFNYIILALILIN